MKERPILFSGEMVRAILDGSKTQTRRVIKVPGKHNNPGDIQHRESGDKWYKNSVWSMRTYSGMWGDYTHRDFMSKCPYGEIGDKLWVKETWFNDEGSDECTTYYPALMDDHELFEIRHIKKRPSIFMPRWASRLSLRITNIRVERLHDISEEDAIAEGIQEVTKDGIVFKYCVNDHKDYSSTPWQNMPRTAKEAYKNLWEKINGKDSWDKNPWVWVVEFRRV